MYILGISCYYHDSAAALLHNGIVIAAAEEERFSRIKHDYGFPHHAIDFCLAEAGISANQLDYVVFYEKPLLKFERILLTSLATFPYSWASFRESMVTWFNEKLWIKSNILKTLALPEDRLLFVEHHLSHAASAFFASPYDEAAILTVDGVGEWTTTAWGTGQAAWNSDGQNKLSLQKEVRFPHSLGLLYSAFTAFLGFQVNEGEYKVMGMAPYGNPNFVEDVEKVVSINDDGSFRLNLDYFSFHHSTHRTYSRKFESIFGEPRHPESEFFTRATGGVNMSHQTAAMQQNQRYADIAASIQVVTEEALLKTVRHIHMQTGQKKLCLAGGVALNSVANGRIIRESPFDEVWIAPSPGDAGGALGCALYAYHVMLGKKREYVQEHAYLGKAYDSTAIRSAIDAIGVSYEFMDDTVILAQRAAQDIASGKVIGWFQGKFEWGPRALGNRSILADPRRAEMKEIVNTKIKGSSGIHVVPLRNDLM